MTNKWIDFDGIKKTADVTIVLQQLGFYDALELRGDNLVGKCMLGDRKHGKKDSLNFNVEKKTFKCYACKKKGSVIDFVMHAEDLKLHDAAERVGELMSEISQQKINRTQSDNGLKPVSEHIEQSAVAAESTADNLYKFDTPVNTKEDDGVIDEALRILRSRLEKPQQQFIKSETAKQFFTLQLAAKEQEVFAVIFLNSKNSLLEYREMFYGTVNEVNVYPREIIKHALRINAVAIIAAHNHPSHDVTPSSHDRHITESINTACKVIDLHFIDHIIVGAHESMSLKEHGWID